MNILNMKKRLKDPNSEESKRYKKIGHVLERLKHL